ncbi:protein of unknown function [Palleronia marisminoris]|uniref:DUF4169 domain-containing protein n=1 Tax=Palleronia marisminoris TaxID=315423 RepID=A0A1Y5T9J6_9RHOB|nr:DUF4169 family protein [Palleronia marisminoris]SFH24268.1 protein of unknown function [Palleronia marisminoris]SLN58748.1 hypothetical protein PAM7066_02883 [Palleronia marisminoris]
MSDPVNLNRARKDRARAEKRREADTNAVKFGRTKAEREAETARAEREAAKLEGHKREE